MTAVGKLMFLMAITTVAAGIASGSASAAVDFEAEQLPATVTGEQLGAHVFTGEELKVSCAHVSYSGGELSEPRSSALTLTPSYTECTALGSAASVQMNGCQYVYKATEKSGEAFTGTTDLSCPTGKTVLITAVAGSCEATIKGQTGLSGIIYRNQSESTPINLKIEEKVTTLVYTVTKDNFLCPFKGTGERKGGSATGNALLQAQHLGEATGLGVLEALPTTLCSAPPEINTLNCPAGKAYGAVAIKAASATPTQPVTEVKILEAGVQKNKVECQASNMTAKTSAGAGNPLLIEEVSFTYGKCTSAPGKTACTVEMTNAPQTGRLNSLNPFAVGTGRLNVPFLLRVECGAEVEKCTYQRKSEFPYYLEGAAVAVLRSAGNERIANAEIFLGEEKNCFDEATIASQYEVTAPQPLWVTP